MMFKNKKEKKETKDWEYMRERDHHVFFGAIPGHSGGIIIDNYNNSKVINKALATIKIADLIEHHYGGLVDYGEQKYFYCIFYSPIEKKFKILEQPLTHHFISFNTKEQAEEFLKNNLELCKDYYMVD